MDKPSWWPEVEVDGYHDCEKCPDAKLPGCMFICCDRDMSAILRALLGEIKRVSWSNPGVDGWLLTLSVNDFQQIEREVSGERP